MYKRINNYYYGGLLSVGCAPFESHDHSIVPVDGEFHLNLLVIIWCGLFSCLPGVSSQASG